MTAGNQPSLAQVNQSAGSFATQLRDVLSGVQQFNAWLGAFGGAAALQASLGFSEPDAAAIISTMGNLDTLRQIYQGIAVGQALPFSFAANSEALWGGQ